MQNRLSLSLVEYETNNPSKGDYLSLSASVESHGYRGTTTFWSASEDFSRFSAALTELAQASRGVAELVGGYGNQEFIRLRLAPIGPTGRVLVEVALAADGHRDGTYHKVDTAFTAVPSDLVTFEAELARFLTLRAPSEAILHGERG